MRVTDMPDQIFDPSTAALQNSRVQRPGELAHGFLAVPEQVKALLDQERAKHPAEAFASAEERLLQDWTLQFSFEPFGYGVLYRPTAQGPEVLAVGFDEIREQTEGMNPTKMVGLKTWVP
jgi:hypothetical protein